METVDGLKAMAQVFDSTTFPPKQTKKCKRCKKEYDPQIPSQLVCQVEHPWDQVKTEWDGSKKSWSHCNVCDRDFGLEGFHPCSRRVNDPYDDGPYCFEGEHDPVNDDDEESKEEGTQEERPAQRPRLS